MALTFGNPVLLAGLSAAAVPLLIHLITRKRAVRRLLPTFRFLVQAEKQVRRRSRLQQWLLLLLRMALIALLALFFARPAWVHGGILGAGDPLALVVIVDNSLSMAYREGGESRLARARAIARRLLAQLRPQDRVAVIPVYRGGETPPVLSSGGSAASHDLEAITLSLRTVDYTRAFHQAVTALSAPGGRREILLLSDGARGGWGRTDLPQGGVALDRDLVVRVVRLGTDATDPNLAVRRITVPPRVLTAGVNSHLEATVANLGPVPREVVASLTLEGRKVDQKLLALPGRGEVTVSFPFRPERPGPLRGEVRIGEDGLLEDDGFVFSAAVETPISILLVEEAPAPTLSARETFFVGTALTPEGAGGSSAFAPRALLAEALERTDLTGVQIVLLCNVRSLSPRTALSLARFVRSGGGLLLFVGDRVRAEEYNRVLVDSEVRLLPARLREIRRVPESAAVTVPSLPSARFHAYYLLGDLEPGARAAVRFANGDPFVVEKREGKGRVLLVTSTCDRRWNDFGLKASFLPFLQDLVRAATGRAAESLDPLLEVGEEREVERIPVGGEERPGVYTVTRSGHTVRYAVNASREESDLTKLTPAEIRRKLSPSAVEIVEYTREEDWVRLATSRRELTLPFVVLLLFVAVAEMVVAGRLS